MRFAALLLVVLLALPGLAQAETSYRGLWLSTPYPDQTHPPADEFTVELTIQNFGLPPQHVALAVAEVPKGWAATFLGDGAPVGSVDVAPDGKATVKLRLRPVARVDSGVYRFRVSARSTDGLSDELPISLTVGEVEPLRLKLAPELPALRGTPGSDFTYRVSLKNDGGEDALVQLDSATPEGFVVTFKEAYGSRELTSVPVKAGEDKKIDVKVEAPRDAASGDYVILAHAASGKAEAETQLGLEITGQPTLRLSGPDGRLSGEARAGEESALALVLVNAGTAPALDIGFSSSEPSGWKVAFEPKGMDVLAPGAQQEIKAIVTPPAKAIAGDYAVTLRANGRGSSASSEFRVTVTTSTIWGVVGIAVIAAALLILGLAVIRYGRR